MSRYQFCNRPAYFRQLAKEIKQTKVGDRVGLATMSREPLIVEVVDELIAAARRGVEVYFMVDAILFTFTDKPLQLGPLWFGLPLTAGWGMFGQHYRLVEKLRQAGGHVGIVNRPRHPFNLPIAGRSHIKTAVINDRVYIGGHNLSAENQLDIMTYWEDQKTADIIFKFLQQVVAAESVSKVLDADKRYKLDNQDELLIDRGQPHQSLILDEALALIDNSNDWLYMTCQYFPGGQTGQHLKAAVERGVKVTLMFSPPSSHKSEWFGHKLYELRERSRLPAELFAHKLPDSAPLLHAKLIATEQGAIIGSHNYVDQGVRLGTAEIALLRRDPAFAEAAVQAIQTELKDYI